MEAIGTDPISGVVEAPREQPVAVSGLVEAQRQRGPVGPVTVARGRVAMVVVSGAERHQLHGRDPMRYRETVQDQRQVHLSRDQAALQPSPVTPAWHHVATHHGRPA